jgi:hypothetical protein
LEQRIFALREGNTLTLAKVLTLGSTSADVHPKGCSPDSIDRAHANVLDDIDGVALGEAQLLLPNLD